MIWIFNGIVKFYYTFRIITEDAIITEDVNGAKYRWRDNFSLGIINHIFNEAVRVLRMRYYVERK